MIALSTITFLAVVVGQVSTRPADALPDLADAYVDGSYGVSIRPPKGWTLIRQQQPESHGITLLRIVDRVSATRLQEIVLKRTSTTKPLPIAEMLERVVGSLELEFNGVKVLTQQVQTIAGKPGAVLTATFMSEGVSQLRLQGIIELRAQQYYVLLYNGPAELRDKSEPLFHHVLNSIKLLADELDEAQTAAASAAAVKWMSAVTADDLAKAVRPEEYLEVKIDGESVGVVIIMQGTHTWRNRQGVRIQERGWTFDKSGQVRRLQSTMFLSGDLRDERWKTSVTTLLPAEGDKPERLENAWEEGVREADILLSNQTYRLSEPPQENPSLRLPKTYVPRVLTRLLPRLIGDLSKPAKYVFTAFDHQKAGLTLRIVELKGASELPEGAGPDKVYRIDEREGVAEPSSLYVDETGRLLFMRSGGLTMRPAPREELEKRFADRIDAAEAAMARLEKQYQESQDRFMKSRPPPRKAPDAADKKQPKPAP